jgi:hypothetical protein
MKRENSVLLFFIKIIRITNCFFVPREKIPLNRTLNIKYYKSKLNFQEASGHPSSVTQGLDIIARLGRFIEFSVFGSKVTADWSIIGKKR